MNINERFSYKTLEKVTYASGARHYLCPVTGAKLPSVTTILSATSEEKKELLEWRKRVGDEKAEQIKKEALALGTLMHTHLESYIAGTPRPGGNNVARVMAERMADQIIERGLPNVNEVWGSEVQLYQPELYAGTTDLVGLYNGAEAILDFKTAKKLRSRSMIEDYMVQMAAYGIAHNDLYGTDIKTGVVFMVSRDYEYESFVIEGAEFERYQDRFFDRLDQFIRM
jgi:hypothetical protein